MAAGGFETWVPCRASVPRERHHRDLEAAIAEKPEIDQPVPDTMIWNHPGGSLAMLRRIRYHAAVVAEASDSILHDHRRIVEFDYRLDMKVLANHLYDALVHERTGGTFIVPQINSSDRPVVLFRMQELFPDQTGHVAEFWCGLLKCSVNLLGGNASRQLEAGNDSNQVFHGTIDSVRMAFCERD